LTEYAETTNHYSEGGLFIGKSARRAPQPVKIQQTHVTPAWARTNLPALYEHVNRKPFFFAWDADTYPSESLLCWTEKPQRGPDYESATLLRWSIDAVGVDR
jgi:hypothetical protein